MVNCHPELYCQQCRLEITRPVGTRNDKPIPSVTSNTTFEKYRQPTRNAVSNLLYVSFRRDTTRPLFGERLKKAQVSACA
jgi:hypothetical protein